MPPDPSEEPVTEETTPNDETAREREGRIRLPARLPAVFAPPCDEEPTEKSEADK